jgi:hypothetical protein
MGCADERARQTNYLASCRHRSENRKELQLAGLRFAISRAQWFVDEAKLLGIALKDGKISMGHVDTKLAEMGALDLVYRADEG